MFTGGTIWVSTHGHVDADEHTLAGIKKTGVFPSKGEESPQNPGGAWPQQKMTWLKIEQA